MTPQQIDDLVNENSINRPLYNKLALDISFEWQNQLSQMNKKDENDEDNILSQLNFDELDKSVATTDLTEQEQVKNAEKKRKIVDENND